MLHCHLGLLLAAAATAAAAVALPANSESLFTSFVRTILPASIVLFYTSLGKEEQ